MSVICFKLSLYNQYKVKTLGVIKMAAKGEPL